MKVEDKELLLKDLCSRLPYGVICHYNCVIPCDRRLIEKTNTKDVLKGIISMSDGHIRFIIGIDKVDALEGDIKPYLRPMDSMTEEEKIQLSQYACIGEDLNGEFIDEVQRKDCAAYIDWLNKNHFDYRGLIPKDLAIAVIKENNPYNNLI